ncbi:MAG: SH3 domain-containing protein [Lachnospiraceae bacterium]|nr:SH3 domain-containing protein [Lachnospiraceae bacterium]
MIKKYIAATAILISAGAAVVITAMAVTNTKIQRAAEDTVTQEVQEYLVDEVAAPEETLPPETALVMEEPTEAVQSYIPRGPVSNEPAEEVTETQDEHIGLTALAQCENAVNVRSGPSTNYEVVGKIYNNCAAEILDVSEQGDGVWYLMQSGEVRGYIKAEFFLTGEEAEAKREEVGIKKGIVLSEDGLNVRSAPDSSDPNNIYTVFMPGVEVLVIGLTDDGWAEIDTDDGTTGYVKAEYLDIRTEFKTAITMEEENRLVQVQLARIEAARIAQEQYEQWLAESKAAEEEQQYQQYLAESRQQEQAASVAANTPAPAANTPAPAGNSTPAPAQPQPPVSSTTPPAPAQPAVTNSELRNAIVAYALQFVGNPYVHGGRSLVTGTDCSGFTYLVYDHFGIRLPSYTPAGQMNGGRAVPLDQIQPGDLLFYPNNNTYPNVGHVAMYIGNGQIVHAGNESTGIQVREAFYREPICARSYAD